MERSTWTNERLDDMAANLRQGFERVDQNFARVDQDIRDLRGEMNAGFQQLRGDINDLRSEFRTVMFRVGGGVIFALIGVIAAILARGG